MGRKKKRRGRKGMKFGCLGVLSELAALRSLAEDHCITVEVNEVMARPRNTLHVMFRDDAGTIVLHYWPGTGKMWAPEKNAKGSAADCWEALDAAQAMLFERGCAELNGVN